MITSALSFSVAFSGSAVVYAQNESGSTEPETIIEDPPPADELPPAPMGEIAELQGAPMALSLREVVITTLAQNLGIEIQAQDQEIAAEAVLQAWGIYDPVLGATGQLRRTDQQTGTFLPGASDQVVSYQDEQDAEVSLSQRTPLGTNLEIFAREEYTNRLSPPLSFGPVVEPEYRETVGLRVTQPLLKNFGPLVTNAQIRVSKKEAEQADWSFRREVENRVSDVMKAYWDLDFALRNAEVQRQALESAEELRRVNQKNFDVGRLPRLSVYQAEAQVAQRESLLADAEAQVIAAQDRLWALMNWDRANLAATWDRPIQPTDRPSYDQELKLLDQELVNVALDLRPDHQAVILGKDIAQINHDVARRQRLPELNAVAGYNFTGVDDNRRDSLSTVEGRDFTGYYVGLEFRYPLFNREARGAYRQSQERLQQTELTIQSSELGITQEVRAATRDVRTALKQIVATTRQVRADIEKLEAEQKRLSVGERTVFDVLDFQDDLALSRANQARALADYQKALIELGRSTGVLLMLQGVEIENPEPVSGTEGLFTTDDPEAQIRTLDILEWNQLLKEGKIRNPSPEESEAAEETETTE